MQYKETTAERTDLQLDDISKEFITKRKTRRKVGQDIGAGYL